MPTATVNGVRLYYELHGDSGEPLVLVHGYTGDISDWRFQIDEFSSTHRVLALDLRGHGRSEAPADRSSYTIDTMSRDVEELVDGLGLGRFHLVGHSMGGGIAQEIALRSPKKLLSLTLHDTSCKFEMNDPIMVEWRRQRIETAEKQGMAAVAALAPPMPPPPHMPPERLQETAVRLANMSVDGFIGAMAGLLEWKGTVERAAEISVPTLIIYGSLDGPALVKGCEHLAKMIPNVTVEVVPECGHSPQYERPELFNRALRRHIEANRASV